MAAFLDVQFISPAVAAVADVSPGSITNGITAVQSSVSTATQIAADLVDARQRDGRLQRAVPRTLRIMRASDAAKLAAKRDTAGGAAFPDVTVRGGMLLGIPVIVSTSVPVTVSGGSIVVLV
jgi:hypothetical protein